MNQLLGKIYALSGVIYTPKEIMTNAPLIMHISDTPSSLYNSLERFIKKVKPTYIIHTGNFSDHLRLNNDAQGLTHYKRSTKRFLGILESSDAKMVYGVFGNFDNPAILESQSQRINWIEDFADITLEGMQLRISHLPKYALSAEADISLFGHDLEILSYISKDAIYLNGLESIHMISLDNKQITHIEYPIGTNDTRQKPVHISF